MANGAVGSKSTRAEMCEISGPPVSPRQLSYDKLTVRCRWEDDTGEEEDLQITLITEAKRIEKLAPYTHGWASLRGLVLFFISVILIATYSPRSLHLKKPDETNVKIRSLLSGKHEYLFAFPLQRKCPTCCRLLLVS